MKKRFAVLSILLLFSVSFAHMSDFSIPQNQMNEMMQRMMGVQITNQTAVSVSCSTLTELQLEEYGDALMERMIGNHELHDQMELMMGPEATKIMHLNLAKNSLGCVSTQTDQLGVGMMGNGFSGMMMYMMPSMMRSMMYQQNYVTNTLTWNQLIVLILIIGFSFSIYLLYSIDQKLSRKR